MSLSYVQRVKRVLSILLLMPLLLAGADWTAFRSGPFEVLSGAGAEPARQSLNTLEQLRQTLRQILGKQEIEPVWQIRLIVFDSRRSAAGYELGSFQWKRDAWVAGVVKGDRLPIRECARFLLESSTSRMPAEVEEGLVDVLSTLDVDNTIIRLGDPPPVAERSEAWARIHLLTVSPEYAGRVRVFFSNLQQGADRHAAYRNSLGKEPSEIDAEVERYTRLATFPTRQVSGATINPKRDFQPRDLPEEHFETALADLLSGDAAAAAYQAVLDKHGEIPDAYEGLGRYAEAVKAGSKSARCLVEYGKTLQSRTQANAAYAEAAKLNPRWGGPHALMARAATTRALKIQHFNTATTLDSRNVAFWESLARLYIEAKDFREAGRAWTGAMKAAGGDAERERLIAARRAVEQQRVAHDTEQRRREAEERERELKRLKDELNAAIRKAEEEANADEPEPPADREVVEWWDDDRPKEKIWGQLTKVDCLSGIAVLNVLTTDGQATRIAVRDPSQIVLLGPGGAEQTLGCGVQDPPGSVAVEYFTEPDPNLKTAGDANVIEFRR